MSRHRSEAIRDLLRRHQVVTVIGARGTGKTAIADRLLDAWRGSGITPLEIDAGQVDDPAGLTDPLAGALSCDPDNLTAELLPPNQVLRIVVDRCDQLSGTTWFAFVQERWRALLSSRAARGRVGVLLLGRPLLRQVAGGRGSPLLNLGPVVATRPLSAEEVGQQFHVELGVARAVHRKTGGHPQLTGRLIDAIGGELGNLGSAMAEFLEGNERYLMRLAEDHTVTGLSVLEDLIDSAQPIPQVALIGRHFGSAFSDGLDVLTDLEGAGLVRRERDRCCLAADLFRNASHLRQFIRAPDARIPIESPGLHTDAAVLTYTIENCLRQLIVDQLSAVEGAWWPTRVPSTLVGEAESRRKSEQEGPGSSKERLHPI
ncbi:MAG: hypothetical protein LC808_15805, partial [Actinobacteria bacterium]|nr:hypothetical protein [Actinomycetota bacterium]